MPYGTACKSTDSTGNFMSDKLEKFLLGGFIKQMAEFQLEIMRWSD
jgi:hypothetical protein